MTLCLPCEMRRKRLARVVRRSNQPSTPMRVERGLLAQGSLLTMRLRVVLDIKGTPVLEDPCRLVRFMSRYQRWSRLVLPYVFFFLGFFFLGALRGRFRLYLASISSSF